MPSRRAHAQERRRDRRIPVVARVRIEGREACALVHADLIDVSAGGLRAAYFAADGLTAGAEVDVEITVQDSADDRHPPLVNLRGTGRVVRVDGDLLSDTRQVALAFTGGLSLREPFAQMLLF